MQGFENLGLGLRVQGLGLGIYALSEVGDSPVHDLLPGFCVGNSEFGG